MRTSFGQYKNDLIAHELVLALIIQSNQMATTAFKRCLNVCCACVLGGDIFIHYATTFDCWQIVQSPSHSYRLNQLSTENTDDIHEIQSVHIFFFLY